MHREWHWKLEYIAIYIQNERLELEIAVIYAICGISNRIIELGIMMMCLFSLVASIAQ